MALTRAKKEKIATTLTLVGQGDKITFNVVYHNRRQSEVDLRLKEAQDAGDQAAAVVDVVAFMVAELPDSEYPCSAEGFTEMEDDRPGTLMGIIAGYHQARQVEKEKN